MMDDTTVQSGPVEKDNLNDQLGETEQSQVEYQLSMVPFFDIEPIPIPVPQTEVLFVPPRPAKVEEKELILRAKEELFLIKAGHKRKMQMEFKFGTPEKKRTRQCLSGPPSVETSPLTPSRKEKIQNIRRILFAKNLSQVLEEASRDSNDQQKVVSDEDNNGYEGKLGNKQLIDAKEDYLVEKGKEQVQLENDEVVVAPNEQGHLLRNDQLVEVGNNGFVELGSVQIDNGAFMDLMKENLPCDWNLSLDDEGKKLLQSMITYVCADGETTFCVANVGVENGSEVPQDGMIMQEEISNEDVSVAEESVYTNSNERLFRNPRTGKEDPAWFEKPAKSTVYHDVLRDRDRFRYMIFKVAKGIKKSSQKTTVTKTIKKVLIELGYSDQQIDDCFDLTRAMYYRFYNLSMDKCEDQFRQIMKDVEFLKHFDETVGVVLKKII